MSDLLSQGNEAFPPASMAQEWKITAYVKEGACMLQDQLVGIRFVFTVGDIHLKFVCLKRTKTRTGKHPFSLLLTVSTGSSRGCVNRYGVPQDYLWPMFWAFLVHALQTFGCFSPNSRRKLTESKLILILVSAGKNKQKPIHIS